MANRKLEVIIAGDSRSLERSFSSASRSAKGFSATVRTSMSAAAKAAVVASAAIGAGVAAAAVKGVNAASDLNEQMNKASVVFGKSAEDIKKWSETSAAALGLAQSKALETAGSFGQLFETSGLTETAAANMSKRLVELAADIASFNNIDPTEALEKLRSGLTGEAEPLRTVGVLLSETRVKQEAYRIGIAKVGATLTEGQKVQARYNLILKDTATAHGDFARTSTGMANALRITKAQLENAAASLGRIFLPAVQAALNEFNDFISDLGQARTVRAKLRVVLDKIEGLALALSKRIGDAVAAIDWDAIWKRARGVADGLQRRLEQADFSVVGERIGDAFSDAAKVALPAAKDLADRITKAIDAIDWEKVGRSMGPGLASAIATAFVTLTDPSFWARNWDLALAVALAVFPGSVGRIAGRLAGELAVVFERSIGRIAPRLGEAFRGLAIQAVRGFAVVTRLVGAALAPIEKLVQRVFGRIGKLATFTVRVLGIQAVINAVTGFARTVGRIFGGIGEAIGHAFEQGFDFIVKKAIQAALAIVEPFSHIPKKLGGGVFQDLKASLKSQLDGMTKDAQDTSAKVNTALASIKDRTVTLGVDVAINGKTQQEGGTGAAADPGQSIAGAISGALDFFQGAIDKANQAAKQAGDTAAKSVATGAANAKKAAAAAKKAATEQRKAFDSLIDSLGLKVDRAAATKGFADDLKANTELQAAIRRQIAVEGNTTELASQLFQAQQARAGILAQQAQAAADARAKAAAKIQATQFKALGLTAEGDARTPGVPNLKKQLEQITARLGPEVAPKIEGQLKAVGRVLSGALGKVTLETRRKILELFQTIRSTFDQQAKGPITATTSFNVSKFLKGLAVPPDLARELRSRASNFNSAGIGLAPQPAGTVGAFGMLVPQVDTQVSVRIDGRDVEPMITKRQKIRSRRNPPQKRGPHGI